MSIKGVNSNGNSQRGFVVNDALWQAALAKANREGVALSTILRSALEAYTGTTTTPSVAQAPVQPPKGFRGAIAVVSPGTAKAPAKAAAKKTATAATKPETPAGTAVRSQRRNAGIREQEAKTPKAPAKTTAKAAAPATAKRTPAVRKSTAKAAAVTTA
jgi:hypothetical protein